MGPLGFPKDWFENTELNKYIIVSAVKKNETPNLSQITHLGTVQLAV